MDERLVEDDEAEPEPLEQLVPPLKHDGRRAPHDDALHALPQQQLLKHEAGLDGLPEPDVVGDEEVHAGERERLPERLELVALGDNPGAQRRLKQRRIRRCDAPPAERVKVGSERPRIVRLEVRLQHRAPRGDDARVCLGVPDDVEPLSLGVVVDAGELDDGGGARRLLDVLHEVGPLANADEAASGELGGGGDHGGGRICARADPRKRRARQARSGRAMPWPYRRMKAALSPTSTSTPILFVDDSALARVAVKRRLVALGLEVVIFGSAAEAAGAHGAAFSAALLDIDLGDGFGPDLAARLREGAPGLPIAFFTAGGPAEVLEAAARIGPVFSKTSELDDAVRWILEASGRG